jgi:iron complex outermembrane receptor protein
LYAESIATANLDVVHEEQRFQLGGIPSVRKSLLATATLLASSGSAFAADLGPPVYAPPPAFTWAGLYIGGQIGYQWGNLYGTTYQTGTGDQSADGGIGGAHLGYNWQVSQFVFGLEGDLEGSNYQGSAFNQLTYTLENPQIPTESAQIPLEGSLRGRVGIAFDRMLLYATGGAEFASVATSISLSTPFQGTPGAGFDSHTTTRLGWTVGGGIEYAYDNNWSVRAEYRHTDLGSYNFLGINTIHPTDNRAEVGFSYKFNFAPPPTPVVASPPLQSWPNTKAGERDGGNTAMAQAATPSQDQTVTLPPAAAAGQPAITTPSQDQTVTLPPAAAAGHPAMAQAATPSEDQTVTLAPAAAAGQPIALPTVEVVATTPVGTGLDTTKVPSEVQSISGTDIEQMYQNELSNALNLRMPGVSVTDEIGSPLVNSVDYRGETASPVPGMTQGLAVYQNGVRINESYGDVVNWDVLPTIAVDSTQIVSGDPIFGLNALAGAVVINMKNGFTWQGTEFDTRFGSDFRRQASLQYGYTTGNWASYFAAEAIADNGFRYFGQTSVWRSYGDIGYRAEGNEAHVSVTLAEDLLGVAGTTPLALEQQNPWAVFTTPQSTHNSIGMIELTDKSNITSNLQLNGNVYFRDYNQSHVDGNISDFYHCGMAVFCNSGVPTGVPDPTNPSTVPVGTPAGEDDDNWTSTRSAGATLQLTDTDKILGHNNNFTAGVSDDHGWTHFEGASYMGTLPPDFVVQSYGIAINDPGDDISPVDELSQNNYLGVYVLDAFDLTDQLTVTAGARYNNAQINLQDQTGEHPFLNTDNNYQRINPVAGATFKISPNVSVYGSYSEANRAPTPLELGCSSPSTPCQIDNFLVADPPLQQVVARTVEAGFKGNADIAAGHLDWTASLYRTENQNDIMVEFSQLIGIGYYANAGNTLRQGVDLAATYKTDNWSAYASYSHIQAIFLTPVGISSPNNPYSNANGVEQVLPGDNIPGIPQNKFKIGFDYTVLPHWTVGADFIYNSSRYYFGDEINALPPVPGFYQLNLHTSYQINKTFQIYGLIENVTDHRYATYGTLYETDSTLNAVTGAAVPGLFNSTDPRSVTIAAPLVAYVGMKITF